MEAGNRFVMNILFILIARIQKYLRPAQIYHLLILAVVSTLISCASMSESNMRDVSRHLDGYCGGYGVKTYIDDKKGHYCVITLHTWSGFAHDLAPANIPLEAIEYALSSFGGIPKSYIYFDQLSAGVKKGFYDHGWVEVFLLYGKKYYWFSLFFESKEKHLTLMDFSDDYLTYKTRGAVDLTVVDTSVNGENKDELKEKHKSVKKIMRPKE